MVVTHQLSMANSNNGQHRERSHACKVDLVNEAFEQSPKRKRWNLSSTLTPNKAFGLNGDEVASTQSVPVRVRCACSSRSS